MAWQVVGNGPLVAPISAQLSGLTLSGAGLVVVPAFSPDSAWAEIVDAPAHHAAALMARLPDAARDADGEWRAPGGLVLILDHAGLVPGAAPVEVVTATTAAAAWICAAALNLAPRLRVNALALDPGQPGDLAPILTWLAHAHAVTGQIIRRGPVPRPQGPARAAADPNLRRAAAGSETGLGT